MHRLSASFACVLLAGFLVASGCGGSNELSVSAPPESAPDTSAVEAARMKADAAYTGGVVDVPGEEALHGPQ